MINKDERKELQNKVYKCEEEISSIEEAITTLDLQIESAKSEEEKINLENASSVYYKELGEKKLELERLQSQLVAKKRFNREQCLNNIDMLLTRKNKKLGELEINSGNRPGYLSRMKSGKSNSDPSIEFLMTASDELEVPLDLLVGSSLANLTSTEEYMSEFIKQLISDTNEDKLEWIRETLSELENIKVTYDNDGYAKIFHPLYEINEKKVDSNPVYNSLFFKDCKVKPCGNGYYTTLIPAALNEQRIYIMECNRNDNKAARHEKHSFFEIYMVEYGFYGNTIVKKICNTLEANSLLITIINSLVKTIIVSFSHIHLDDHVRNAIDTYMNQRKIEDEDDDELPFN